MKNAIIALVFTIVFLTNPLLNAQELTGTLRGLVTDQNGLAIEGALVYVTVGSDKVPTNMNANTDSGGGYVLTLPPGEYFLTFERDGFNVVIRAVSVHAGGDMIVNTTLEVAGIQQEVTVQEKVAEIDTGSSGIATTISSEEQTKIPSGIGFVGLLTKAPGVRAEPVGGGFMADGSSAAENDFYVNGVKTSDTQTGALRSTSNFPFEFVEETEIRRSGDAQYGNSLGAVVNGVLKRGTNNIHGQLWTYATWDGLNASPRPTLQFDRFDDDKVEYFQNSKDRSSVVVPGFLIGFPILKDKVFFLSGSRPSFSRSERDVRFLKNNLLGTFASNGRQDFTLNKVDADLLFHGKVWRLSLAHIYSPLRVKGFLPGRDGTGSPDTLWDQRGFRAPSTLVLWSTSYFPSSQMTVSVYGGWNYANFKDGYGLVYGLGQRPSISYLNSNIGMAGVAGKFQASSGDFTPNNLQTLKDKFKRTNLYANVTYLAQFRGSHLMDFGYQLDGVNTDIYANTWPDGRFLVGWGLRYPGVRGVISGRYGFVVQDIFETSGKVKSSSHAFYFQDKWQVRKNLVLNLGVRAESEHIPSFLSEKRGISFGFSDKISPRLGLAYDPTGSGNSKVSVGFAATFDMVKYNLPISAFGGDKWLRCFYPLDDPDVLALSALIRRGTVQASECLNLRVPSNDAVDPSLKPMQQRMLTLGYERSFGNLTMGVYGIHKYLVRAVEDVGRLAVNQGTIEEQFTITNPGFGRSIDPSWFPRGFPSPITPKAKRDYRAIETRLEKRAQNHFWSASYTLSRLYGNYSGLASSDERGRLSPNTNRDFDLTLMSRDKDGQLVYGRLATDRSHVFKFFGSKGFSLGRYGQSDLGVSFIAESGTPLSTQVMLLTGAPAFAYGRGNLGRTPMFSETGLTFGHEFKLPDFKESQKVRIEWTVGNVFNQKTALDAVTELIHPHDGTIFFPSSASVFRGYDPERLMEKQGLRKNPAYGMESVYQASRSMRMAVRFFF